MITNDPRIRFGMNGPQLKGPAAGWLSRVVTALVGTIAVVSAIVFSFVIFVTVASVAAIAGAWLWWKTRHLRRQMRERAPDGGRVIEGEVIRTGEDAR